MTTEIAIMNKSALALAADSAVTISVTGPQGRSHKVLNTANKLFALSKYAPVGLMVYGNAAMLGIPWETIVKMYREKVGDKVFPSLEGYARSFFRFLDDFPIDAELQGMYIASVATVWCKGLRQRVDQWVSDQFALDHQVTQEEIATTLRNLIDAEYQAALNEGKKSVLPNMTRSKLRRKYRERVARVITDIFENLPISAGMRTKILTIAVNFACVGLPNQSGVVIAGFGREDLFPCCCDFDVAAVFAGKAIR
ncbi:MAG: hypothetical protein MI741_07635 [Rhodospirillales bacterium]|nr:hypothetical protein [Rhodospirillales bacterium]